MTSARDFFHCSLSIFSRAAPTCVGTRGRPLSAQNRRIWFPRARTGLKNIFLPFLRESKRRGASKISSGQQNRERARLRHVGICRRPSGRTDLRGCAPFRVDLQWSLAMPGAERSQGGARHAHFPGKRDYSTLTLGECWRQICLHHQQMPTTFAPAHLSLAGLRMPLYPHQNFCMHSHCNENALF